MAEELYDSLNEMYGSFLKERERTKEKIDRNLERISEIDAYLERLSENDESDFKIFSPRSAKEIYKEDREDKKGEKEQIEIDNQYYYKYLNRLDSRIRTISAVLHAIENGSCGSGARVDSLQENASRKEEGDREMEEKLWILDIQEKERQRISRDLHDSSLQNLAHLTHKIELASLYMDQDPVKAKLELATVNKDLKTVIQEIRNTIFNLRPMSFDDLGLKESLERLVDRLKESSDYDIRMEVDTIDCDNSLILMTLFRIAEECMNNAVKHSSGNRIVLRVKREEPDRCSMVVSDNGQGFKDNDFLSDKDRHFGLCILKERVSLLSGTMDIASDAEKGTTVTVSVPL